MKRGVHPSNWLTASDFSTEGTTYTIARTEVQEIDVGKEKTVVFFKEIFKGLVLNEINQKIIEKNTGTANQSEWVGFHITPYKSSILMRGELTPCIRIKIEVGRLAKKS